MSTLPEPLFASLVSQTDEPQRKVQSITSKLGQERSTVLRILIVLALAAVPAFAQKKNAVHNILLVHGAWADGSSWSKVVPLLLERGFNVVAVQNPLSSLTDDVTATKQAITRMETSSPGPVLLVGHSYGGTIITEAGTDPNVVGLVYIAAFAPDEDETTLGLANQATYQTPAVEQFVLDSFGFVTLSKEGIYDDFAQDVSPREKELLFATQGPTALSASLQAPVSNPAWRKKPTWFLVASQDRTISPLLEQFEASRMKAVTITVPTSHVAMISEPTITADFIAIAAQSLGKK